jgi:hypothetical protein
MSVRACRWKMQMKGKDINKTILHQVLKTMSTTILLYFLYNYKDLTKVKTPCKTQG